MIILNFYMIKSLFSFPVRRAQSLPQTAEPVDLGGDEEIHSPPPPYSAPAAQSYSVGNGSERFYNFSQGQGSEHASKQPSAAEANNQILQEEALTESKLELNCHFGNCDGGQINGQAFT